MAASKNNISCKTSRLYRRWLVFLFVLIPAQAFCEQSADKKIAESFQFFLNENKEHKAHELFVRILHSNMRPGFVAFGPYLEAILLQKNRNTLNGVIKSFFEFYTCFENKSTECEELSRAWVGHLDSILFHDRSSERIQNIKNAIDSKDCLTALRLNTELEAQEGVSVLSLSFKLRAYECDDNLQEIENVKSSLKELSLFNQQSIQQ